MNILGISCFYHDAAAALLVDGELVAAAEEERFSRKKHDNDFPIRAIHFCLEKASLTLQDIDDVVFYEKPFLKFDRILKCCLETYPRSLTLFREAMIHWLFDKLWVKSLIEEKIGIAPDHILFSKHHLSHAASAFLCSPFEQATLLTVDGVGEWQTATIGKGEGNTITLLREMNFPHSVGLLYSVFTAFLGFEVNEGEYKVMGLAPYGKPRYIEKIKKIIRIFEDGSIWLDPRYFCHHYSGSRPFNRAFEKLFGTPRNPQESDALEEYYSDLAASIQAVIEEIMVKMARFACSMTGIKRLCLAGGVALNTVANRRILEETPVEALYVQPAAGDSGGALGAALWGASLLGESRRFTLTHAYWGRSFQDEDILRFLEKGTIPFWRAQDTEDLVQKVVSHLEKGNVVGWMQGRFEWGPRALGNRSILADPRRAEMKEIVNEKIKFREPFRPFAPSILSDRMEEYFEMKKGGEYPSQFMLLVPFVKPEKRGVIPAVTHVDGTGRLQAVAKEGNPLYYRLIECFEEKTGVPVLLNTSFNLKGEPIVTTPEEAYNTFMRSEMDALVLGSFVVEKEKVNT